MKIDQAQQVREEDRIDEKALSHYLKLNLDDFCANDTLTIKQFIGGASNLTYLLEWHNQRVILRTSPCGANIKSAHDMGREFKVLSQLKPHFDYAPAPLLMCDDESIIGRPFYLMEKVDGIIPRKSFPLPVSSQQARKICEQLIGVHVALHEIDIEKTGLIDLGYPQGYVSRQISGWIKRYKNACIDSSLDATELMTWLESNQKDDEKSCVIHNDYKLDNVILSATEPTKIIAVLDWEMTTIGSPLMDLGCSLAYWIEKNDAPAMQAIRMMPTQIDGMMTRDEIVDYYAQLRGMTINNFNFYYVFGLFRLAVIVQQIYKRYATGKTSNPAFKGFGEIAKILIRQAESLV
jgi:aminoglycoside phosphotransferase (APT) family kinase protein